MRLLTSLVLENYRGFRRYSVAGLRRVNLLVGKNGCGKTSILEALWLLARDGDPSALKDITMSRRELLTPAPRGGLEGTRHSTQFPEVTNFFHGYQLREGAQFQLRPEPDSELRALTFRVVPPSMLQSPSLNVSSLDSVPSLAIQLERAARDEREVPCGAFLTADGAVLGLVGDRPMPHALSEQGVPIRCVFISPRSCEPLPLDFMWDNVVMDDRKAEVEDAMRIVAPQLAEIFFLTQKTHFSGGVPSGIMVRLRDSPRPIPLGSLGDGALQSLKLSLSLVQAGNGMLLADEIDSGLHYSIMGDMWRTVVEWARLSNVQVFATTHSLDCVRGLAWLCANYPDLGTEVSLQKIVPSLEEAVAFDAESIMIAAEQDIEVR